MRAKTLLLTTLAMALLVSPAYAQETYPSEDITREQIEMVLKGMIGESIDRQLKVADIGDGNVAVGILHRTEEHDSDGELRGIIHTQITEVYVILDGWGTLLTDGELLNATEPSAGSAVVGPTFRADSANGKVREIKQGDVVIIPAGTLHGWITIPDHVTYLSIRTDPHGALPAGYVREGLD